jgi:hypothetical protein
VAGKGSDSAFISKYESRAGTTFSRAALLNSDTREFTREVLAPPNQLAKEETQNHLRKNVC